MKNFIIFVLIFICSIFTITSTAYEIANPDDPEEEIIRPTLVDISYHPEHHKWRGVVKDIRTNKPISGRLTGVPLTWYYYRHAKVFYGLANMTNILYAPIVKWESWADSSTCTVELKEGIYDGAIYCTNGEFETLAAHYVEGVQLFPTYLDITRQFGVTVSFNEKDFKLDGQASFHINHARAPMMAAQFKDGNFHGEFSWTNTLSGEAYGRVEFVNDRPVATSDCNHLAFCRVAGREDR